MARERQMTPIVAPTVDSTELGPALEDDGGLSALGPQKQAPIRFDSSSTLQGSDTLMSLARLGIFGAQWRNTAQFALTLLFASLGNSDAKADSPSQSLAAVVDTLVGVPEDQFLNALTEDDYQRFVASLDKLIDVVGEDETHPLAPLMHFISNLIEKYEEQSTMANWTEPLNLEEAKTELRSGMRLPVRGLEAAYGDDEPEYTRDMLISVNPDYAGLDENGKVSMRLPVRGLEAAYGDDEPEYTLDMLISVNPEYGKS